MILDEECRVISQLQFVEVQVISEEITFVPDHIKVNIFENLTGRTELCESLFLRAQVRKLENWLFARNIGFQKSPPRFILISCKIVLTLYHLRNSFSWAIRI